LLRRSLTNVALALCAFLLTGAFFRWLLPFPEITPISEKFRFYEKHRDEIDTLFFGSSRIYQQLSPAIFDTEMRAQGLETRSFNFGVNGMFLGEESYLLEKVLPHASTRLRWVFIELEPLPISFDPGNSGSQRIGYWHDLPRTRAVIEEIFRLDSAGRTRAKWEVIFGRPKQEQRHDLLFLHLSLFAKNFLNLGQARDVLDWWQHRSGEFDRINLGPATDGYRPLQIRLPPDKAASFEEALRASMATARRKPLDPATEEICRRSAAEVLRCGAQPIFVVTPVRDQTQFFFAQPATGLTTVLSFNDAIRYPDLYRTSVRLDSMSHLNEEGAQHFSRHVAERFAAALREGAIK
jgi:hypothetical protein